MIMVYVWFVEATVTYGKWMMDTGCQKGEVLNFLKLSCIHQGLGDFARPQCRAVLPSCPRTCLRDVFGRLISFKAGLVVHICKTGGELGKELTARFGLGSILPPQDRDPAPDP